MRLFSILCSVEIRTAEEEAAERTDEFAAFVAQLGGAIGADLHDFASRLGVGGLRLRMSEVFAHKLSSQRREYMSSPATRRRSARNCGGKKRSPVSFCRRNCAITSSEIFVGRHASRNSWLKASRSGGRYPGRSEIHASFRSAQKTSRSSRVISPCCQRGLNGKNGNGLRSTTRAPGHMGTSGGLPPLGNFPSESSSLRLLGKGGN